jgi:hypothetical protein
MLVELCCVVGIHIHSWHHELKANGKPYNDTTPGLYIRTNDTHTVAGIYENSINKKSFYVGKDFETNQNRRLKFGITLGLVTGYNKPVLPFVVPSVTFDNVRFTIVPHTQINAGAINAAIEFKF